MGDTLRAAVGHDEWDLWRHRTEPVTVVLNPERILFDNDASIYFDELDAAEGEIQRRESAIRIIWGLRAKPNAVSADTGNSTVRHTLLIERDCQSEGLSARPTLPTCVTFVMAIRDEYAEYEYAGLPVNAVYSLSRCAAEYFVVL
jgi:hypothetical protein